MTESDFYDTVFNSVLCSVIQSRPGISPADAAEYANMTAMHGLCKRRDPILSENEDFGRQLRKLSPPNKDE